MGVRTRNIIVDAGLYIGSADCIGRVTKIGAPTLKYKGIEINDLGSVGTYELNTGKLEKVDMKITLNCFYEDVFKEVANPFNPLDIVLRGNVMEYAGDELQRHKPLKLFARGTSKELPLLGEFSEHDNMSHEITLNLSAAREVVDNNELYHFDIPNDILIINGVDMRAQINANLGIV